MNIIAIILKYFDLNKRAYANESPASPTPPPLESVAPLLFTGPPPATEPPIPIWKQLVFYLGLMVGILLSCAVMQFQSGKATTINITITTFVISCVVAFAIMSHVYEKALKPEAVFIIRFGLFVQSSVFC